MPLIIYISESHVFTNVSLGMLHLVFQQLLFLEKGLWNTFFFFPPIKQPPLEVSPVGSKIPSIVEVSAFWQHDSVLCIFNLTTIQIFLVNLRSCTLFLCILVFFSQMILQLGFLLYIELNSGIKVWKIRTSEEKLFSEYLPRKENPMRH